METGQVSEAFAMKLHYYISGHGLGHASRSCEIIAALRRRHRDVKVTVVSDAHPWFLRDALDPSVEVVRRSCDCGVVQRDSLVLDIPATAAACRQLSRDFGAQLAQESALLKRERVDLVVSDIPALPLVAAAHAGVPGVGVGNFTWDWIYRDLAGQCPECAAPLLEYAELCAGGYRQATRILRLPFAPGEMGGGGWEDVPLVARTARQARGATRAALGIPDGVHLALVSFGGFGLEALDLTPLGGLGDWVFLAEGTLPANLPNLRPLVNGAYAYPDLVAAADVVITKPGYGIVSEAIANQSAVLYTSRGRFPEQELLVAGLRRYTRCREISNDDLRRGAWGEALAALLAQPLPQERLPCDGAALVAERLVALAGDSP